MNLSLLHTEAKTNEQANKPETYSNQDFQNSRLLAKHSQIHTCYDKKGNEKLKQRSS